MRYSILQVNTHASYGCARGVRLHSSSFHSFVAQRHRSTFDRETAVLRLLGGSNYIPSFVSAVDTTAGVLEIRTEWIDGCTLDDIVAKVSV